MLRVQPHDPGVVDHLVHDHHVVVGLHDALQVVVERGQRGHRRLVAGQTAIRDQEPFGIVPRPRTIPVQPVGSAVVGTEQVGEERAAPLALGGHRRLPAVGRVGDDRGPDLAVDQDQGVASVDPEGVVAADVPGGARRAVATGRRRLAIGLAGGIRLGHGRVGAIEDLFGLLRAHVQVVAELCRTLQRRQGGDVVSPTQVGLSAGGPGDVARGVGLGRRSQQGGRREGQQGKENEKSFHERELPVS